MSLLQKRKNPEPKPKPGGSGLTETDKMVLNLIKSKKEMAIWRNDIKYQTKLPYPTMNKCLKNLQALGLIEELNHYQQKGKPYYIAAEFKPSEEVTGGAWFANGVLDTVFIDQLKSLCGKIIHKLKAATADGVYNFLKENRRLMNTECNSQQISEILRSMVLNNDIIEVISTGVGDFDTIPVGNLCYICRPKDHGQGPKTGAMVSIPCGICPRIRQCTPDGLISPSTCVYFTKWLDF